jgi:hypothetical protein
VDRRRCPSRRELFGGNHPHVDARFLGSRAAPRRSRHQSRADSLFAGVRRHFGNFLLVHAVLQQHLSVGVQGCLLAKSWTNFACRKRSCKISY